MQESPPGQVSTHFGESNSPSHSVQVSLLILKIPPFSTIDLVGQTGTQSPQDVLTLLAATLTMKEKYATRPLITMSMGKSGGVSRVTGRLFGSAMTFGTVGQASAPGQIAIAKLREVMDILS